VCDDDDAEPVGVGSDFDAAASDERFLVMRCNRCGVFYLALHPRADDHPHRVTSGTTSALASRVRHRAWRRLLRAIVRPLPPDARVLAVGAPDDAMLLLLRESADPRVECVDPSACELIEGDYDLVLLAGALSRVDDPARLLRWTCARVRAHGRAMILTEDTGSLSFHSFRGRHWAGYHFPRRWFLFDERTLPLLARRAGLEIVRVRRAPDPDHWLGSMHHVLADWGAPRWLVRALAPGALTTSAMFVVLDGMGRLVRARGTLLAECRAVG
jgi:hypothetical protein